jgi:DNA polymerase-3 subunit epsilon
MRVVGCDIETTGLEPGDHRIVEFYSVSYYWEPGCKPEKVKDLLLRINPERSIQIEAQRVHGISLEDLADEPRWLSVANEVRRELDEADLIIGHNIEGFDMPFINYELQRIKLPRIEKPLLDTMLRGRWATPQGKVPNLGELCFACDITYDTSKAHAASYDVDVMMRSFFRAHEWGFFPLPSPVETVS